MGDEVLRNLNNVTKCICPVCPVQAASACVGDKRSGWEQERRAAGDILAEYPAYPEAYDMELERIESSELGSKHGFAVPDAAVTIELYCAQLVGASECEDLDAGRSCQCPTCAVWETHHLGSTYYCIGNR